MQCNECRFFVCFLLSFSSFPTHIYLSWEWETKNDGEVRKDGKDGVFFREMIVGGLFISFGIKITFCMCWFLFWKSKNYLAYCWCHENHPNSPKPLQILKLIHSIEINPSSHSPKHYIFISFYSYFSKKNIFSRKRWKIYIFSSMHCLIVNMNMYLKDVIWWQLIYSTFHFNFPSFILLFYMFYILLFVHKHKQNIF